jgi:hypothetical protein
MFMRHVIVCLLAVAGAAVTTTAAPAQGEVQLRPRMLPDRALAGMEERAQELIITLSDVQREIAIAFPGRRGAVLYEQARTALDEAVRLREAIQTGASPLTVQARISELKRELRPLLEGIGDLNRDVRGLQLSAARISSIQRRLEVNVAPSVFDPVVRRQISRVTEDAQSLQQDAWRFATENPVFVPLAEDIEAFTRTMADFHFMLQDPDASPNDLMRKLKGVRLAWARMVTHLEVYSPRQLPALYAQAGYLAGEYRRLHRQLGMEGEPLMPPTIATSVRPTVPYPP